MILFNFYLEIKVLKSILFIGIDVNDLMNLAPRLAEINDVARKAKVIYNMVKLYQDCISSLELCCKPVLASIHSACIGAGINMVTAADMRYCTKDAYFQVKEVCIVFIFQKFF